MELNEIKKQGKWTDISDTLNENFAKVNAETQRIELASRKNKGYFATASELTTKVPTALDGDIAYVGAKYPYNIYRWVDGAWVDSGEKGGEEVNNITNNVTNITGDVVNNPDDEDLVENNGVLKLKDRDTSKGMGYVILRTDKTFAEQVTQPNTIYEIRYDFDLGGAEVEIPENCVLKFEGGSLSDGTITGFTTKINAPQTRIFTRIKLSGDWSVSNIYQKWFDFGIEDNYTNFQNLITLTNPNVINDIYFESGEYPVLMSGGSVCMQVNSNTTLHLNSCIISIISENVNNKTLIRVSNAYHVKIIGGTLIGHAATGLQGDQNHGISINNSSNVSIQDTITSQFTGDGIIISQSSNCTINSVRSEKNNRQGLSLLSGTNIKISSSKFNEQGYYIKEEPAAGIDIEPWADNMIVKGITIQNCELIDNAGWAFALHSDINQSTEHNAEITIENCTINGAIKVSHLNGAILRNINRTDSDIADSFYQSKNITVNNIRLGLPNFFACSNVVFNDCELSVFDDTSSSANKCSEIKIIGCNVKALTIKGDMEVKDCTIGEINMTGVNTITNSVISSFSMSAAEGSVINDSTIRVSMDKNKWRINDCTGNTFIGSTLNFQGTGDKTNKRTMKNCTFVYEPEYDGDTEKSNNKRAVLTAISEGDFTFTNNKIVGFISFFYRNFGNEIVHLLSDEYIQNAYNDLDFLPLEGCRDIHKGHERVYQNGKWNYLVKNDIGESRPSAPYEGMVYFDAAIKRPIWWTGSEWVDATGATV